MAVTLNLPILPCESPEGSLDARVLCSPKARVTLPYPRGSVITMKGCERHEMVCRFLFGAAVDCGAVDCGLGPHVCTVSRLWLSRSESQFTICMAIGTPRGNLGGWS